MQKLSKFNAQKIQAQGYKTYYILNSAEHEIYPAYIMLKCQQAFEDLLV